MHHVASLGYPTIGMADAVELWRIGAVDDWQLSQMARRFRQLAWAAQRAAGIDHIACGETGFGDPIAETAAMVGAVPAQFGPDIGRVTLDARLALATGDMARKSWAGSHLSYVSPQLRDDDRWRLNSAHAVAEQLEARSVGINPRPVLIGPFSFLAHCHTDDRESTFDFLERILPAYREVITQLAIHGAKWVQIDEPILATAEGVGLLETIAATYRELGNLENRPQLMVATYGGNASGAVEMLRETPVDGLHVDLVSAPDQLGAVTRHWPVDRVLSVGVVDAANPSSTDLRAALHLVHAAQESRGPDSGQIAPSMPLTAAPANLDHAPLDHVPQIETGAVKLRILRTIADAANSRLELPEHAPGLPDRPDLSAAALA